MFVSPPLLLHIYQNIKAVMSVFSRAPGAPWSPTSDVWDPGCHPP